MKKVTEKDEKVRKKCEKRGGGIKKKSFKEIGKSEKFWGEKVNKKINKRERNLSKKVREKSGIKNIIQYTVYNKKVDGIQ